MPADRAASLRRRLWSPPAHWRLLAFCLAIVVALIFIQGVITHTIGPGGEPHEPANAAAPLAGAPPLLTASRGRLIAPERPPGREVALTFDDGPYEPWTREIAAVLHANHVPATFFVIGSQAVAHPGLVSLLARDGFEIGNHTFTHMALTSGSAWEQDLQLSLTEAVLTGITGRVPRFVRPPYSSGTDALTASDARTYARLAGGRYVIALSTLDSDDWQRKGVARIVAAATPAGGHGGTIQMHDGGGNRAQTVAALRVLIPLLRARGYRFVTVRQMLGLPAQVAEPPASTLQRIRGLAFLWALRLAFWLTSGLQALILAIGALLTIRIGLLVTLSRHHTRRTRPRPAPSFFPSVSVVVPAYNEAVGIERAVRSLAASDYPDMEVVVVDDGSTDETAAIASALEAELSGVRSVSRPNGGKAAALATGIRACTGEIVVMVDGDTVFEPDTIQRLVQPLADPRVGAVSGNTKVGNRSGLLGRWQHIEYVTGFNLDRRMYEVLQCTPTVPGAVGAFRRTVLEEVGGPSSATLAEDTDLTLAIGRHGHRVVYADDARAWTEAPSTLSGLWRQRYRWSYGTMQAVWKHRRALWSREARQRRIGRRALPYMLLFQILLPLVAPLIDLFAAYGLLFSTPLTTVGLWLAFTALQLGLAVYAFRLDGESMRPLWALPLQQFVYRQLMYLVIIESTVSALLGLRAHWQHIERTGDVELPAELASA